jgi:predicted TIM-barrel fold metal-dependent hydrolase
MNRGRKERTYEMAHQVISADCHLDPEFLSRDAFTSNVAKRWEAAVPQVKETPEGPTWFAGDVLLGASGTRRIKQVLGLGKRGILMQAAGFDLDQLRPGNPTHRIEDQDRDGVDAELIYGPLRRWRYLSQLDAELAVVIAAAYNEFIAQFCAINPKRLYALGAVPPTDPVAVVKELEHIAQLGLAGAEVSLADPAHPIFDRYWDPVWSAAVQNDVVVHIHVQEAAGKMPGPDRALVERAAFICGIPLGLQPTMTVVLLSGLLERHPKLRMVFAEAGAGWIPYMLDRIDYEWENSHAEWSEFCKITPSELFRRQMYATFQEDAIGPQLAHLFPNNFLWGSDYPHADGIWPDSHDIIKRTMGNLDPALRQRIVHDNAADLYRIGR